MFSIGMMLKDEEEYLQICLNNLGLIHQDFTVIDTGSTDATKDILEKYNIPYSEEIFTNYSEIRNLILKKAMANYVLMLDGDETITDKSIECDYSKKGYILNRCHYLGQGYIYFDQTLRLLRNISDTWYENDIFEGVALNPQETSHLDTLIHHFGYLKSNFKNKVTKNLTAIQKDRMKNERSVQYSMEALYMILQNKIEGALNVIKSGKRRFENVWFYILEADIYKAKRDYLAANKVLDEAKSFCYSTMSAPMCEFYLSRIILKQSTLAICQNEYERATELLFFVEKPLEYGRLINEEIVSKKVGNEERATHIRQKLEKYSFDSMRRISQSRSSNVYIVSDVYSEVLIR